MSHWTHPVASCHSAVLTAWVRISSHNLVTEQKKKKPDDQYHRATQFIRFKPFRFHNLIRFLSNNQLHKMSMLRNIVRSSALKLFAAPAQKSMGIQAVGARSLWHMSKPSATTNWHKCTGGTGCMCGCGKRYASTNGKFFNSISFRYSKKKKHRVFEERRERIT